MMQSIRRSNQQQKLNHPSWKDVLQEAFPLTDLPCEMLGFTLLINK